MSDEPEILPPHKAPARRDDRGNAPARYEDSLSRPTGVISSKITGWLADAEARAYGKIAERIRAQTDVLDAETERCESALKLWRKTHELEEVPEILALDRAERRAERAKRYAAIDGEYQQLDYNRDERGHQAELTKLRRERELQEARRAVADANRALFNSEQGLENQQRVKQLNLEIWEKRAATQHMDAEKVWLLLNREMEGIKGSKEKERDGTLEELSEMRTSLEKRAQEAAANGDAVQSDKYLRLAGDLDDLVVAVLHARAQK